jgi:hypothetical protein
MGPPIGPLNLYGGPGSVVLPASRTGGRGSGRNGNTSRICNMVSLRAGISTLLGKWSRMPGSEPTPELFTLLRLTTDGDHHSGQGDHHSGDGDHHSGDGDHHSGTPPQSGRIQIGISGRPRSERVVACEWNGWSPSPGIRTPTLPDYRGGNQTESATTGVHSMTTRSFTLARLRRHREAF